MEPTITLLGLLMLFPMIVVFRYSLFDNVIMNKYSTFVGLQNYEILFSNATFWVSVENTLYLKFMSVIFHLLIEMTFTLMLNSKVVNSTIKLILRVFYIMPWVYTAVIIAIIWRLLLDPSGVTNYLLMDFGITDSYIE
jgi:multiple sugar transport system permease protein